MGGELFHAELFCLRCGEAAIHSVQYHNQRIAFIRCEQCGRTIGPHLELIATGIPTHLTYKKTIKQSQLPGTGRDQPATAAQLFSCCYRENLLQRIVTKPSRLKQEMHKDLKTFLRSIPIRVVTKPLRMAKEMSQPGKC